MARVLTDEQRALWMEGYRSGLDHGRDRGRNDERARLRLLASKVGAAAALEQRFTRRRRGRPKR